MIETERLLIVPFSERYLTPRYVGWLNDPEVVRYSDQRYKSHTLESCREYWGSFTGTPHYFWAIVARDCELGHIGTLTAYVDPPHSVADLAILIGDPAVWGEGCGSEAWSATCSYLLGSGGMRKVTAGTLAQNKGMLGIMRRTGMVEDGVRIRQYLFEGQETDMVCAAIFREGDVN